MHFKLIYPTKSQFWDQSPQNAGFNRDEIIHRLEELRARGHDYEIIDGDALSDDQRREFYRQAFLAVFHGENRYRIRQIFGSRKHGGGDHLGTGVPALIVSDQDEPVDVYPHQVGEDYHTIRSYLTAV